MQACSEVASLDRNQRRRDHLTFDSQGHRTDFGGDHCGGVGQHFPALKAHAGDGLCAEWCPARTPAESGSNAEALPRHSQLASATNRRPSGLELSPSARHRTGSAPATAGGRGFRKRSRRSAGKHNTVPQTRLHAVDGRQGQEKDHHGGRARIGGFAAIDRVTPDQIRAILASVTLFLSFLGHKDF